MKISLITIILLSSILIAVKADPVKIGTNTTAKQSSRPAPIAASKDPLPEPTAYTVVDRGADYRVLQRTTVVNGTNQVHKYTELATGMNYTNSYGQWTEAKEQISVLPQCGAAATQGRHQVYFPADIYNGVLEVVTPDGRHLQSRPLGVAYSDGSNTVFIATLTNAVGWLTASNQVTYRNCFTGIKADIVCTYRRGGFECDLVLREQPPTPDQFGLDTSFTTLQHITEFFNTQDPQQVPATSDEWFGLQDETLKFGKMTMKQGKAFAIGSVNSQSPAVVYKSWLHLDGRTFLIEQVPLVYVANDLGALPLTSSIQKPATDSRMFASNHRQFPPAHEVLQCTNQILIASADLNKQPGVVLDYNEVTDWFDDYTFETGQTYLVSGSFLGNHLTIQSGAVVKAGGGACLSFNGIASETTAESPAVFTSMNDDTIGEQIEGSSGVPQTGDFGLFEMGNEVPSHVRFYYAICAIYSWQEHEYYDLQFFNCSLAINDTSSESYAGTGTVKLRNVLFSGCGYALWQDSGYPVAVDAVNVTADGCDSFAPTAETGGVTNSLLTGIGGGTEALAFDHSQVLENSSGIYQTAGNANYYLAVSSPYHNAGTTNINSTLLAELRTMTTYAPQDGGFPDTNSNHVDLGYHYPVNEDSDYDDLPDWWEWNYFGTYAYSGTNIDGESNTLLYDCQHAINPNPQCVAPSTNAIGWWAGDGDADDSAGTNNGVLYNGNYVYGKVGQTFNFDGYDTEMDVPDSDLWAFGTNNFTIELWANFADYLYSDEGNPQGGGMIASDEGGGDTKKWWFTAASGVIDFHINDPDNGPIFLVNASFNPNPGSWYHLAITKNGTNYTIYTNGVVAGSDTCNRVIPNANAPLTIGQAEGFYFYGQIDEPTIYNRALSGPEIAAIYSARGAGKCKIAPECVAPPTNVIGWWAGDGNASDLVNTNNGVLYNGNYVYGKVDGAFNFDGYDTEMDVPDSDLWAFGTNNFTIELWANFADYLYSDEGTPQGGGMIASDEGGGDTKKWWFTAAYGVIDFHINDPVNGPIFLVNATFNPNPGGWYHLAVTRSNQTFTIYVNGQPVGTDTSARAIPNANAPLTIGQAEGFYFYGQIDEPTIYNRALSGPEIAAIYSARGAGKCKTDLDFDGLPDWWEWQYFGTYAYNGTNLDADGNTFLYDYTNNITPTIATYVRLGYWPFDNTNTWVGSAGQLPLLATNVIGVPSWNTNAVLIDSTNPAALCYRDVETNGNANINLRKGTARFWFKPDWSSASADGTGPGSYGRLIEMGYFNPIMPTNSNVIFFTNGWWSLYLTSDGNEVVFGSSTNGAGGVNLSAPVTWVSNQWHQIVLTYTRTNSLLYLDGQFVTNGAGSIYYPNSTERAAGFRIGSDQDGNNKAKGVFDELEIFDYPLDEASIQDNFETARNLDSDGDGLSNILENELGLNPYAYNSINGLINGNGLLVFTPLK